ncbi:hypothetical protein LUZ60_002128 [Juncus effusus]|nr:hypothetical protein LUZ60_002128 [Juncus effusus]
MDPLSPQSIILLFLSLLFFIWHFTKSTSKSSISNSSSLKPYPLIGHLPQFLKNRHRIFDWFAEVLAASPTNTIVFHRPGGIRGVITANPSNVEHILKTHFDNYPKGERVSAMLHDFLGSGIFNADGETGGCRERLPAFNSIPSHCAILSSFAVSVAERVIDLQDVLERFAFDNVCKVSFDFDPCCLESKLEEQEGVRDKNEREFATRFADAFRDATNLIAGRFQYAVPRFWKIKKLLNIGSERRLHESISTVHSFADQIIRLRKETRAKENQDLLSRYVVSSENYSDEFLRDIVISFLLAGRETTSSALSWFFWILSSRPDVEAKLLDEIRSLRAQNGGSILSGFNFEELKDMHYLHAAITESMRLYPPVPINTARALEDDQLPDGTQVKKGWFVSYNSYAIGRMEANWGPDWAEYKPERWINGDGTFRQESPYKFTAFHAGPRICLGKEMAYIQMKSIVACVLDRFKVEVKEKNICPEKVTSLTLRMKDGLLVRVRERKD